MSPFLVAAEKAYIDISVFLAGGGSAGVVSGTLELASIPGVGESLSLLPPPGQDVVVPDPVLQQRLEVEHVIHSPLASGRPVMLVLAALTVADAKEAIQVAAFFEQAWGLGFDPHFP